MSEQQMREQFEEWARSEAAPDFDRYVDRSAEAVAWLAWQAASRRSPSPGGQAKAFSSEREGWRRECADADELLRLMFPGRDPDEFRTDGGSINLAKVRDKIASRARYRWAKGAMEVHESGEFVRASASGVVASPRNGQADTAQPDGKDGNG